MGLDEKGEKTEMYTLVVTLQSWGCEVQHRKQSVILEQLCIVPVEYREYQR